MMTVRTVARISLLAALGVLLAASPGPAQDRPSVTLENEFVRIVVNVGPQEAGRFSIKTTGGDPTRPASKDQDLIFGGDAPWTSYTTVLVDDAKYVFGGSTRRRAGLSARYGEVTSAPAKTEGQIATAARLGDIEVAQRLGFARGSSTRMLDTVGITYIVTNRGKAPHQVGLRVLLDTMCGANDGAPVRAGAQAITTATALAGKAVPEFWHAFDRLANPTVVSQGTLRGGNITPPDHILFADWGTLADEPWEPAISAGQGFIRKGEDEPDTAAALFWDPTELAPGESRTFITHYGIGEVTLKAGQLTLGMTAPAETTFQHERTQPFTIAGYLQNTGGFDGHDVTLTLTLPSGLKLLEGSKLQQTYAQVKPDETLQQSWIVQADGAAGGDLKLVMEVTSANIEANRIERKIQVNVPTPTLQLLPVTQAVPPRENDLPKIIPIQVNLSPAEDFYGVSFTLRYDPNVLRPLNVSRGPAFVEGDRLLPGWRFDTSQDGVVVITGKRVSAPTITQAEANIARISFRAVGLGKSALRIEQAVLINADGKERTVKVLPAEIEVTDRLMK